MADKQATETMFANLAKSYEEQKTETAATPVPEKPKKKQRKRGNADYIQVGPYIPKTLNKKVKRELLDYDGDFSDLIIELLEKWLAD